MLWLNKKNSSLIDLIFEERFSLLLILLFCYMFIDPFIREYLAHHILIDVIFSFILISSVWAVCNKKIDFFIASFLAILNLIIVWLDHIIKTPSITIITCCLDIVFVSYIIYAIMAFIFSCVKITRNIICSAIVVYLFIGFLWSNLFMILEMINPGSIAISPNFAGQGEDVFFYFSFTTLTTLGYGDITPITPKAISFAVMEATIGQIYLVVLIARLVGMHISQQTEKKE